MPTNRYINVVGGQLTQVVPATTSTGAASAGQIIALNSAGTLDSTMLPSGVGADAITATASAAITAGALCNIYNNAGVTTVRPADSTSSGSPANAYAPAAISSGATGTVYAGPGIIPGLTGLTIGATYFLGTVGGIVTTAPSSAGNIVQQVGTALSATSLEFLPQQPITVA